MTPNEITEFDDKLKMLGISKAGSWLKKWIDLMLFSRQERLLGVIMEELNKLEASYLIQDSSKDSPIVKASHISRTMTFVAVRELLAELIKKGV